MPFSGAKLRERRQRKALTLRELGALAGVAYDTIHGIEVGDQQPQARTLRRLAAALGTEPEAFFVGRATGNLAAERMGKAVA